MALMNHIISYLWGFGAGIVLMLVVSFLRQK